jgi:hypothetical protein
VSEDFRHCFERDVTEGWSMSWYFDIDEGRLEDEITLGRVRMWIAVGPTSVRVRRLRTAIERGSSHLSKASSLSSRRMANEIGVGENSNEL